jgi:type VI secretion system protein ImpG
VTLWPIVVQSAVLAQVPLPAPVTPYSEAAQAVLRIGLTCPSQEVTWPSLGVDTLRFYLRGQPHNVHRLYELLFNHTIGVAVTRTGAAVEPFLLGEDALRQVGFDREEGLLPYPARSFLGYRLLTEYFAFPQKFLFVDLRLAEVQAMARLEYQLVV